LAEVHGNFISAISMCRKIVPRMLQQRKYRKADGGGVDEYATAMQTRHSGGMIHSPVPGRTDKLPMSVPAGAYVVPADIVSGLGQGNSAAGAEVLNKIFGRPPGMKAQHVPKPTEDHVLIVTAGGEYLVPPSRPPDWRWQDRPRP
jgi:hypothetical protein